MTTDWYPQEEGAVFDAGSYIVPAYPDGTISELSAVQEGTTVAGRISVIVSSALGDGFAIALKAASSAGVPTRIPILLYGLCKLTLVSTHTCTMGSLVMNNTTTTFSTGASLGTIHWDHFTSGASHVMGIALQGGGSAAAHTDEILILVGRST